MEKRIRRFGQVGRLKKEKIKDYETLHASVWPEVLKTLGDCHVQNYSIFRLGDLVFSYFEYTGCDYERDMKRMEEDKATVEWWKHTKPCFLAYSMTEESEFYQDMKQIFYYEGEGKGEAKEAISFPIKRREKKEEE